MNVGDLVDVTGCITKENFIAGRTMAEVETILGYRGGRLSQGMALAILMELPGMGEFELGGYSNVSTHRHSTPVGLDIDKLKAIARATWTVTGSQRLVKVIPALTHDPNMTPDIQYPPGQGAPQWTITSKIRLRARIVAVVNKYPSGRCVMTQ